jgi:transposase-like protein
MACGDMGRKVPEVTKDKAVDLVVKKGLTIAQAASRNGVSQSAVRKWLSERGIKVSDLKTTK